MLGYPDPQVRLESIGLTAKCRVGVGRSCVIGTDSRFYVGHGHDVSRGLLGGKCVAG